MATRLLRLLHAKNGGNQSEMARYIGVTPQAVQKWMAGITEPRGANLEAAAQFLGVTPAALRFGTDGDIRMMGGRGPKFTFPQPEDDALIGDEKRNVPREQPEVHSPVMVFDADDGVPEHVVLVPESRIEFSAGDGRINYEVVEDKEPVPYQRSFFQKQHINPDRVRRFPVTGDSMEPMLFGGDTILVNLDETEIIDGKLYALRYGDQLRVKYLSKRIDGTLILRSLNPAYKDEEIPAELANEHITIVGRVRDRSGTGGL